MRKALATFFAIGCLVFSCGILSASEINATSNISKVCVYPDSALVTRKAGLKLTSGAYTVIFSDIIPEVDENSLKVSGEGSATVKLFGAQVKKEFLEEVPSEKIKQLKDQVQKLNDEGMALNGRKQQLFEEKGFLDSIRLFSGGQIPKDLVTRMPAAKDLDDTLKFLDNALKENYSQVIECELKMRDLRDKIDVLNRELAEISGPNKKMKRSITVDLEVLKPGDFALNISYLVRGAYWQPIYEARADFVKSLVVLDSYGLVKQTTGEDWQDVEVSLSTAKPAIGGNMPYVSPWFLRPFYAEKNRSLRSMAMKGEITAQYEAFSDADMAMGGAPAEPEYAVAQEKGISVVYTLPRKETIKADGAEHKLAVSSQELKADFQYSSYPRVSNFAYLGSRVTNAKGLQLLSGRVNIFLEGDFVGSSSIENIGPGEEFDLYLGADENVKIKRELIEKKVDETLIGGIPSPNKQTIYRYKLTVENYKPKKMTVKLFEAMPVSEDDRIKVKIDKVSLEPKEKNWKDRKGVWLWDLELAPKEKKEIFYTFTVEHPRQMQVEGL
ncbi:mucoidy inhibitor MuiA family protein [bacterium]|nr:MAG: mucoidy inhibitor MuiA family protein [bacterium]